MLTWQDVTNSDSKLQQCLEWFLTLKKQDEIDSEFDYHLSECFRLLFELIVIYSNQLREQSLKIVRNKICKIDNQLKSQLKHLERIAVNIRDKDSLLLPLLKRRIKFKDTQGIVNFIETRRVIFFMKNIKALTDTTGGRRILPRARGPGCQIIQPIAIKHSEFFALNHSMDGEKILPHANTPECQIIQPIPLDHSEFFARLIHIIVVDFFKIRRKTDDEDRLLFAKSLQVSLVNQNEARFECLIAKGCEPLNKMGLDSQWQLEKLGIRIIKSTSPLEIVVIDQDKLKRASYEKDDYIAAKKSFTSINGSLLNTSSVSLADVSSNFSFDVASNSSFDSGINSTIDLSSKKSLSLVSGASLNSSFALLGDVSFDSSFNVTTNSSLDLAINKATDLSLNLIEEGVNHLYSDGIDFADDIKYAILKAYFYYGPVNTLHQAQTLLCYLILTDENCFVNAKRLPQIFQEFDIITHNAKLPLFDTLKNYLFSLYNKLPLEFSDIPSKAKDDILGSVERHTQSIEKMFATLSNSDHNKRIKEMLNSAKHIDKTLKAYGRPSKIKKVTMLIAASVTIVPLFIWMAIEKRHAKRHNTEFSLFRHSIFRHHSSLSNKEHQKTKEAFLAAINNSHLSKTDRKVWLSQRLKKAMPWSLNEKAYPLKQRLCDDIMMSPTYTVSRMPN